MSKFDLMSDNEPIEIQIAGSVKMLQSILDEEIRTGHGRQYVRLKVGPDNFGIYDVVQSQINEKEHATIIWVEENDSSYSAEILKDQLKIITPTDKIVVVARQPILEKYGYESTSKFKLAGCRVTDISATGQGVMITASPVGKFNGIKTFIKRLELLGN